MSAWLSPVSVLSSTLGLFFVVAGVRKLSGWEWAKRSYLEHHPLWVYYCSAVVEVAAGVGLIVPQSRFAAAIGQLALIAWVSCHPWHNVRLATLVAPVVTTSLLIALAWLTLP